MQIVARRRISGLLEPLLVGGSWILAAVCTPWLTQPVQWYEIAARLWLCLGGAIFIAVGVKGWSPRGIGLVFSQDGFSWRAPVRLTLGSWMISWRWDDVLRAHYVTRKEVRFAGSGAVILELTPGARPWPNAKWAKKASNRLQKQLGRPLSDNVVVLLDRWWDWRPDEIAAWINESVNDPASRARWDDSEPLRADEIASSDRGLGTT